MIENRFTYNGIKFCVSINEDMNPDSGFIYSVDQDSIKMEFHTYCKILSTLYKGFYLWIKNGQYAGMTAGEFLAKMSPDCVGCK